MNIDLIPIELKERASWCVWKFKEPRGKIPYDPRTNELAKSNSQNTFSDFETACKTLKDKNFSGLGIEIFGGFSAIDIDHCYSDGKLSDMAEDIIEMMGSYTERSPSGEGIRIIFFANGLEYDKDIYYIHNPKIGLEIYVSGVTSKFVTITGDTLNGTPVMDRTVQLMNVLDKYMKRPTTNHCQCLTTCCLPHSLDEYIKIGLEKDQKLKDYWNGCRPLKSESENDFGFMAKLLYWTNRNIDYAIQLFKSSPYAQQKDEAHTKKMNRKGYLYMTAQNAMPATTAVEDNERWKANQTVEADTAEPQRESAAEKTVFKFISAQKLQTANIPPISFLVEDILPEGTTILSAAPKIGKSWLVLEMGMCIAAGKPFLGKKTKQAGVLYFALEDSQHRLKERMEKVLDSALAPEQFAFSIEAPTLDEGFIENLEKVVDKHSNLKLIIIDTFQKIRGGAKSRETVYQYDYRNMGAIKQFADKHSVSVMLVHHNRKMVDKSDPFNMISGTNGLMGAADTTWIMIKEKRNEANVKLHITGRDVAEDTLPIQFNGMTHRWEEDNFVSAKEAEFEYIVETVENLLKSRHQHEWKGKASELIKNAREFSGLELSMSPQELGYFLKNNEKLFKDRNIIHRAMQDGNAGSVHSFEYASPIQKAELDDDPIVDF